MQGVAQRPFAGPATRRAAGFSAALITTLSIVALLFAAGAQADAASKVSFATPKLFPSYHPAIHDYVVRCHNRAITVKAHAAKGWEIAVADRPFQTGDFNASVKLGAGREFTVRTQAQGGGQSSSYYVRCLPTDFPAWTYKRSGPVSPKYFAVDHFAQFQNRWAIIFNDHGVPMWWMRAPAQGPQVLPDGTIAWANRIADDYEIRALDGSLVRTVNTVGNFANAHDLQLLPNGDFLLGAYVPEDHVDTSAYGGSSNATVVNAELQEVSSTGSLVWDWKSQDHIGLAETNRFWNWAIHNPRPEGYDIVHWNSIAPDGNNAVIASFRHLDAVYKINKLTGAIVWKLGGTKTSKSLAVRKDPYQYTLGAQHDARLLPDGTVTAFDDRTQLANRVPRAVRYRVNQQAGTATLLQSISDPDVTASDCCGSARRLPDNDWLIAWGKDNPIGGYTPTGKRTFLLRFKTQFSYRAEPVTDGLLSAQELRDGMNAICVASGC